MERRHGKALYIVNLSRVVYNKNKKIGGKK
jgi:hypothetical protein